MVMNKKRFCFNEHLNLLIVSRKIKIKVLNPIILNFKQFNFDLCLVTNINFSPPSFFKKASEFRVE